MTDRVKKIITGIRSRLRHRTFLIRLLVTTLLAAFVPLSIVSVVLIRRESAGVIDAARAQLEIAAQAAAGQFDDYVAGMNYISSKVMLAPELSETALAAGIQNELTAIRMMRGYGEGLPFAREFALYVPESDAVYTTTGKLHSNGLLQHYLNIGAAEFADLIANVSKAAFVPWDSGRGNILYISPIRSNVFRAPSRFAIYILTPDTVFAAMNTLLADRYAVVSIECPGGQILYRNDGRAGAADASGGENLSYIADSPRGYRVCLCALDTEYSQSAASLARNAHTISWISVALCAMLIITVVFFNYRPVARLIRHVGSDDGRDGASELDSVYSAYAHLAAEKSSLSYQLYEKNMLIADRAMENLLSGRKITRSEMNLLRLNWPVCRVVCAALDSVKDVSGIIARNAAGSPVYAIEMYADGRLAFVCGCADDSPMALRALSDTLRAMLKDRDVPLGFSTAYDDPERLFMAYLEAGRALNEESPEPDHVAAQNSGGRIYLLNENFRTAEELTGAIKTADAYMITYAEKTFAGIQSSASPLAVQRYACYQLIEMYRRLGESVGMTMDMEQIAQIAQEGSISSLRDAFLRMLEDFRQERLKSLSSAESTAYESLIQYVRSRFTDPDFSMNDVAEHLGVSIYTASRVMKNLTGVTFRKYLNDLRVERAKELLLTTGLSVQDVSVQAGFSSTSYFIKVFRESEDTTPSNYRSR